MYFFGIFFQLAINFFFQPKCTKRTKHKAQCIRFSKLKAFSVQVSKVEEERKKWSNKFFWRDYQKQIP